MGQVTLNFCYMDFYVSINYWAWMCFQVLNSFKLQILGHGYTFHYLYLGASYSIYPLVFVNLRYFNSLNIDEIKRNFQKHKRGLVVIWDCVSSFVRPAYAFTFSSCSCYYIARQLFISFVQRVFTFASKGRPHSFRVLCNYGHTDTVLMRSLNPKLRNTNSSQAQGLDITMMVNCHLLQHITKEETKK